MSKIQLYIAASLDGYIARPDDSIDWLKNPPDLDKSDYGYADFYSAVDVVVMGRLTYEIILGFDVKWPYPDCTAFVLTQQAEYKARMKETKILKNLYEDGSRTIKAHSEKKYLVGRGRTGDKSFPGH